MTNFGVQNIISYVGTNAIATPTIVPTSITPISQTLSVNNNFGLPQSLAGAAGNGGLYQFMGNDFNATLQAIATAGKAQVLSRPSILARDGQMAEIVVGQSVYLPSGVSFTAVGGTATTVPTINGSYQNVGIQLDVTPFIGANNLVQMILQPQITSIDTSTPGQVIEGGSLISSAVYAPNHQQTFRQYRGCDSRRADRRHRRPHCQRKVLQRQQNPAFGRHSAARQAFQVQHQVECRRPSC